MVFRAFLIHFILLCAGHVLSAQIAPTVTFGDIDKTYGESNFTLMATSNSSGTISYNAESGDVGSISLSGVNNETVSILGSGTIVIKASQVADGGFNAGEATMTLTINKAALTATAEDKSKTYGDANPAFTITYTGFAGADDASVLDTPPVASTAATATSDVGAYTIGLSAGTDNNYEITEVTGTLTINQKALTATADDKSKTYGDANPTFTVSYNGFVNSDTEAVLDTPPVASTSATAASDVGSYTIDMSSAADNNYAITEVTGTLTINQKALTATADGKSKTYGDANPTFTVSYSGFVLGQDESVLDTQPTASATTDASSNAGSYTISVSEETDNNYEITEVTGTLTINQKALTATADGKSKTYGDANPAFTITYDGFVNSDTEAVLDTPPVASTSATAASDVGSYTIDMSSAADNNYAITEVTGTLTINQKALTATADDKSKTYGDANPTFTVSYNGFVNSDTEAVLDTPPVASTSATAASDVGSYTIDMSSAADNNYAITEVTGTLTINQKALTATADGKSKTYGDANPTFTVSYSGFVLGQDESVLDTQPTASATTDASSNAGSYTISVSEETDNNYEITEVTGTLTINQKALTATADGKSKTYGDANPAFTITYDGFVNSDTEAVLDTPPVASTSATAASDVGSYTIDMSSAADNNYAITEVTGTLTINQKALTATADDKSKTYGDANPTFTITYNGFVNSDTEAVLDTPPVASTSATAASDVGSYTIDMSSAADNNYAITEVTGTLTINQKALTATADGKSKTYGDANPTFTVSYSGFVLGQDESVLDTQPTASATTDASSNAGSYTISVSEETDNNYEITEVTGTLTINQKALTATADGKSKTYGDANPAFTITYDGFVNSDTEAVLDTPPVASTSATAASDVGSYTIDMSSAADNNYAITEVTGTLTINQKALTATADDKSKTYGDANPTFTVSYNGFVNSDTEAVLDTPPVASTSATAASDVGSYTIDMSSAADNNYAITEVTGTLTINQKALTATADGKSKTYGDANPTFTVSYSGFVLGQDESVLDTQPTASATTDASSNAGSYTISVSEETDNNYEITEVTGTLTINQKALTATADGKSKTYGDANPTFTVSYSGFVLGQDESVLDTQPTASATTDASSNAGSYTISVSEETDNNYEITEVTGTLTINQKALTATADGKSKTYGDANPAFTITYDGFVNSDTEAVLDTPPVASTSATAASDVGSYTIDMSSAADNNYAITEVTGTLTINQKALTATADDKSKTYGDANPTFTITYNGFVNSDTEAVLDTPPVASTSATAASDVGSYTIDMSSAADNNYAITEVTGTLTINQKALTATADGKSKTYGDANPTFTVSYSGFVLGQDESVLDTQPTASATTDASSNAGSYTISVSEETDNNYEITEVTGTLTINQKALTATADGKSKTYGDANPAFTITYNGFVNSDTEAVLDTPPVASTSATAASDVGSYTIDMSSAADNNYAITEVTGTLTINQKALTATADGKSKTYGDANPTFTVSYNGFVNSDTEAVLDTPPVASTSATAASDVGSYTIDMSSAADNNYAITEVTGTLTINQKALTATADGKSKTYGDANPTFTVSYSGFVLGQDESVLDTQPTASATTDASSNAGSYTISVSEETDNNYEITEVTGTLTINQKALTATADGKSKTYGDANPAFTITYDGFVNSDTEAVLDTPPVASTSATAASDVGSYTIDMSSAADNNYAITEVTGTLTINQKALTATADGKSKTYGDANPAFTITYDGFVNSDTEAVLDTPPVASTSATAASDVGSYTIDMSSAADNNYAITEVTGTLTINQKALTATADDKSKTYGDANPTFTITYNGFVNSDTEAVLDTPPVASTSATAASDVGSYTIDMSSAADNNYAITEVTGTLTINQKALTATADGKSKTYGDANPTFTVSYSGFVLGQDESVLDTQPTASATTDASSNAGSYTISVSEETDNNYEITEVTGTLTINQKALTATADGKSKTYGDANPAFTITYDGFVNSDTEAVLDTPPVASTSATAASDVGSYTIDMSSAADNNYAITEVTGTLTINQKALTATADDKSKTYGDANPTFTVSYNGFVNSDTEAVLDTPPVASTSATAASDVGSYTIDMSSAADNNYAITEVTGTLIINQKALTATADDKSKTYGDANPTFTVSYSGFVLGQDESVLDTQPTASATTDASSNAGSYTISVSEETDNNYEITEVTGTLTINQKSLQILPDDKTRLYGDTNPTLTFQYNAADFVNGDSGSDIDTPPSISTPATMTSDVGAYQISLSGGSDNNYSFGFQTAELTITQSTLVAIADNKTRTYGDANPEFTITYGGFKNGEDSSVLDEEPSVLVNANKASDVNIYGLVLSGGSDNNYAYDFTSNTGNLTIEKRDLTVTANNLSKTYGEANPTLTLSYTNFANDDDESDLEEPRPSTSTTATELSNVGDSTIVVTVNVDNNYNLIAKNGTLTINKKDLTVSADNQMKVYGEANPTLTFNYSGFVNGDSETDLDEIKPFTSTNATELSNAGDSTIFMNVGSDNNYNLIPNNATLQINKATLFVFAQSKTKTYGDPNPEFTLTYGNFLNDDSAEDIDNPPTAAPSAVDETTDVGEYDIIINNDGLDNNYTFNSSGNIGKLVINKKELTVSADDKTKIYGEENPAFTFTYTGFVNGDTELVLDEPKPSLSTNATELSNVGDSTIFVTVNSDNNYNLIAVNGTLSITKRDLTVSAEDQAKVYGETNPTLSFSYAGFVNSDSETDLDEPRPFTSTNATIESNVGDSIIFMNVGSDNNYNLIANNSTLSITKATLFVIAEDQSKTYGNQNPEFTLTYAGFLNTDNANDIDSPPTAAPSNVDETTDVGEYGILIADDGLDNNYLFNSTGNSGTLTINKAPLTARANDRNKVYGQNNPTFTVSYSGFVNQQDESFLDAEPVASANNIDKETNAGTYQISVSEETDKNYEITEVIGTLTINKAPLTATADDKDKVYGQNNPTFTVSYSGFVNQQDESFLDAEPVASANNIDKETNAGTYQISVSKETDKNYEITEVIGTLTINKAPLTATADDKDKVYGQNNPTFTISYSGFVNQQDESFLDAEPVASANNIDKETNAGTYQISVSEETDKNYEITEVIGTLTINKAPLTATADDKDKVYGQNNPTFTVSYSGFVNQQDESFLDAEPVASANNIDKETNAGTYQISVSEETDKNYEITEVIGTLTINKAPLTATADDKDKVYGQNNPTFTVSYSGFVNQQDESFLDAEPVASANNIDKETNAGTYQISVSKETDKNYEITEVIGTLTINKAPLTATADDKDKVYGQNNPTFTVSYSGFVNQQDESFLDAEPVASANNIDKETNAGTYQISVSEETDKNYEITEVIGTLTINKAPLTVIADDKSRCFGETNPQFTSSAIGLQNDDNINELGTINYNSADLTATTEPGVHKIKPSGLDPLNYEVTSFVEGELTIFARPIITSQPSNASGCDRDDVFFEVTVQSEQTPSYQWFVRDSPESPFVALRDNFRYSGVSTSRLEILDLQPLIDNYQFQVRVFTELCPTVISEIVTLDVLETPVKSFIKQKGNNLLIHTDGDRDVYYWGIGNDTIPGNNQFIEFSTELPQDVSEYWGSACICSEKECCTKSFVGEIDNPIPDPIILDFDLTLSPNPTENNRFRVGFMDSSRGNVKVILRGQDGGTAKNFGNFPKQSDTFSAELDISDIPGGIYIVEVESASKLKKAKPLIIR